MDAAHMDGTLVDQETDQKHMDAAIDLQQPQQIFSFCTLDTFLAVLGRKWYSVSHSEMIDSEWLRGVEGSRIFLNYGS